MDMDEFCNASRPKDEQEEAAWLLEWRKAHPRRDDPQEDKDEQDWLDRLCKRAAEIVGKAQ